MPPKSPPTGPNRSVGEASSSSCSNSRRRRRKKRLRRNSSVALRYADRMGFLIFSVFPWLRCNEARSAYERGDVGRAVSSGPDETDGPRRVTASRADLPETAKGGRTFVVTVA